MLLQYPSDKGEVYDYKNLIESAHQKNIFTVVAADLLSLTLLTPPGEFGADVVIGNSQRFGVPMGYGGPHAAFFATKDEFKRNIPGRIIGASIDGHGNTAFRMALQTREQHIRREKATSNICTAQVLLAVMAGMYAVYHGPEGLRRIAQRVHGLTLMLAEGLRRLGFDVGPELFFDTLRVRAPKNQTDLILVRANERRINLRTHEDGSIGLSLDEISTEHEVKTLLELFVGHERLPFQVIDLAGSVKPGYPTPLARNTSYLTHEIFNRYHAEHEMLRYLHRLQGKDLSLTHSMIPLGSCTMKLNATAEMLPVTWPEFAQLHPFAPTEQTQ